MQQWENLKLYTLSKTKTLQSVVRDDAPLLEIFSHELSGIAESLFHNNGEMRNKA